MIYEPVTRKTLFRGAVVAALALPAVLVAGCSQPPPPPPPAAPAYVAPPPPPYTPPVPAARG